MQSKLNRQLRPTVNRSNLTRTRVSKAGGRSQPLAERETVKGRVGPTTPCVEVTNKQSWGRETRKTRLEARTRAPVRDALQRVVGVLAEALRHLRP